MHSVRRFLTALLLVALVFSGAAASALTPEDYDMSAPQSLDPGHLYAEAALLVDEDSGEVLFSKNPGVRMFPASTTKIMTLLLALESDIALDTRVTIPAEAGDVPEGSSVIPVKPGDVMRFSDLLYGFMLSSGNDGANAIAVLVDGSIEAFVEHMNRRAGELGCEGTHYVNAHGYHDAQHYTTARDLALISRFAMENPTFRKIVAAPNWTMDIQRNGDEVQTQIISRNSLLIEGDKYYYPDCTGIKTGHHNKAGWCFVGSAEREGKRVICVVLNCEHEMSKWYDAARLFEYGFTRYEPVALERLLNLAWDPHAVIRVENAAGDDPEGGSLRVSLSDIDGGGQTVQLVSGSEASLNTAVDRIGDGLQIHWEHPLAAPVDQGERLGTLTVEVDGVGSVSAVLTASRSVAEQPAATEAPTLAPAPTAGEALSDAGHEGHSRRGHGRELLIALIALLALAGILAVAAIQSARSRRAKARRRSRARRSQPPLDRRSAGRPPRR